MRIISKFKDYYDTAMQYGQDQSVVFLRNDLCLESKLFDKVSLEKLTGGPSVTEKYVGDNIMFFSTVKVVFCGKMYRGIKCTRFEKMVKQEPKIFYDFDQLQDYLVKYGMKVATESKYIWYKDRTVENCKAFLSKQGTPEFEEYCVKNGYAIITCRDEFESDPTDRRRSYYHHGRTLAANGELKSFQFFKVFDPIMAYQELDMYVSGVLPQASAQPIEIEDKYRIAQHGFDKMSFRKPKGK